MAGHGTPHFHNQPGLTSIKLAVKEFKCIGALPPFDHPHIYIDMGADSETICPYCSTRFVYDPQLTTLSDPASCEVTSTEAA